jgi:hypothetical protein
MANGAKTPSHHPEMAMALEQVIPFSLIRCMSEKSFRPLTPSKACMCNCVRCSKTPGILNDGAATKLIYLAMRNITRNEKSAGDLEADRQSICDPIR